MELDHKTIVHRQQLFSSSLEKYFQRKVRKYRKILLKSGIHLTTHNENIEDALTSLNEDLASEDEVELVLGDRSVSPDGCKNFCKIGDRIRVTRVFRWIYGIVRRRKAARILCHLDGIFDEEISATVLAIGQELGFAFEYQLCMLDGDSEVVKLAEYTGRCLITYLNSSDAHFLQENLLQAVLEEKPHKKHDKDVLKTRTLTDNGHSVSVTWRLSRVLKQPGLRICQDESTHIHNGEAYTDTADGSKTREFRNETAETLYNISPNASVNDREYGNTRRQIGNGTTEGSCSDMQREAECGNSNLKTAEVSLGAAVVKDSLMCTCKMAKDLLEFGVADSDGITSTDLAVKVNSADDVPVDGCENLVPWQSNSSFAANTDCCSTNNMTSCCEMVVEGEDVIDAEKQHSRIINAFEMDFEKGTLKVTEYEVPFDDQNEAGDDMSEEGDEEVLGEENVKDDDSISQEIEERFTSEDVDLDDRCPCGMATKISETRNDKFCKQYDCAYSFDGQEFVATMEVCSKSDKQQINLCQTFKNVDDQSSEKETDLNTAACNICQASGVNEKNMALCNLKSKSLTGNNSVVDEKQCQLVMPDNEITETQSKHIVTTTDTYRTSQNLEEIELSEFVPADKLETDSFLNQKSFKFYGCFTPFGFKCKPKSYGYRGPLHVWNESKGCFAMIKNDVVTQNHGREITFDSRNIHHLYVPKTFCKH